MSSIEHIEEIWEKIKISSKELNEISRNFDGEHFWNSYKQLLIKIDQKENNKHLKIKWDYQSHDNLRIAFNSVINDIFIDKDNQGKLIEEKHFIRQLLWIPHKDDGNFTFRRFMQLALNHGQFYAKKDGIDKKIADIFDNEELEGRIGKMETYVKREDLEKINITSQEKDEIIMAIQNNYPEVVTTEQTSLQTNVELNGGGHKRYYVKYN